MRCPSWSEFTEKLSRFENDASQKINQFKDNHPLLDKALKESLGFLPPPFNVVAQNFYDSFPGTEEEKSEAVIEMLKGFESKNQKFFEKTARKLDEVIEDIDNVKDLNKKQIRLIQRLFETAEDNQNQILKRFDKQDKELEKIVKNQNELIRRSTKGSIKVTQDIDDLIQEMFTHEENEIRYISRREDLELESALNGNSDMILLIGKPGAGKSRMIKNTIVFSKNNGYSTFVLLKNSFSEGDEKDLDFILKENEDIIVLWDDVHERKPEFVIDVIKRIRDVCKLKNIKVLLGSRKSIHIKESTYVELAKFEDSKLIDECSKTFNVDMQISSNEIMKHSDGTPYYIISVFKKFKDKTIRKSDVERLPDNVIDLWHDYLKESTQSESYKIISEEHLNAFRSIGLLTHSHSSPEIRYDDVRNVYSKVFHGDLGRIDYALEGLTKNMFVSFDGEGYTVHDSHIEALEKIRPLRRSDVEKYLEIESDFEKLFSLSSWAFFKKEWEVLGTIATEITIKYSENSIGWNALGISLKEMKQYDKAVESYNEAIRLNPEDAVAYNNRGISLKEMKQYDKSVESYNEAIRLNPEYADAYYNRGNWLKEMKQYDKSVESYNEAIRLNPEDAVAYNNRGISLKEMKQYDKSVESYNEAIRLNPEDAVAYNNRGISLKEMKQYDKSVESYNEAIRLNPEYADAYYNRGNSLKEMKQYDKSVESYNEAIRLNPEDAVAYNNRGISLNEMKQYDKSVESYNEAIRLNPEDADAYYNRAISLLLNEKKLNAKQSYDKAVKLNHALRNEEFEKYFE